MDCPYCESGDTMVRDSRSSQGMVRRRRECRGCGERFTTYEQARQRVSICGVAEKEDTPEAYQQMYKQYAALPYREAHNLLTDAKNVLETKCILGSDTANLESSEIEALINLAGEIADLVQPADIAFRAHQGYRSLTKGQSE